MLRGRRDANEAEFDGDDLWVLDEVSRWTTMSAARERLLTFAWRSTTCAPTTRRCRKTSFDDCWLPQRRLGPGVRIQRNDRAAENKQVRHQIARVSL